MAFPESAQAGQPIKLPGQTRVTPDEYHEFITLGQGGVFELDLARSGRALCPLRRPLSCRNQPLLLSQSRLDFPPTG